MTMSFAAPEGLRDVLTRLHDLESVGHWAWRTDPEAERLMRYTIRKYRGLAHSHRCEPEDSAYAAFEAMRTYAVRTAADPWAVVTRAVQVSLIAEERSAGLLCSPAQARRREAHGRHDARRFCEYESDVLEFHPKLRAPTPCESTEDNQQDPLPGDERPTTVAEAADKVIALFVSLGWPENTATCAMDYLCSRLAESKNKAAAHSLLRRDEAGRASLDLDRAAWSVLLRIVLGNPEPDERHTRAGHGLLKLFLCGYPAAEFLADDGLVLEISESAPRIARRTHV